MKAGDAGFQSDATVLLPSKYCEGPSFHPWARPILENEAQMSSMKSQRMSERRVALREKFWPMVTEDDLWLRKNRDGFATVPRSLPIMLMIMDGMNKGYPVSSVYTDLWCRAPDEMFLQLQSHSGLAFSAGFEGERAQRTWRDRIRRLQEQGFIDVQPGPFGDISYAVIFNPYHVIRRHYEVGHPAVTQARYNALLARADEIGADDLTDDLPDDWRARKPKSELSASKKRRRKHALEAST